MRIRTRLFLGFGLLLFIFIMDAVVNYNLSFQVVNNMNQLNNSETIIRNSNQIHKNMIEMQSGFRGYLLTGQESFLQPYYEGISSIPPIVEEQEKLILKNTQKQKFSLINEIHKEWIDYSNSLITTKRDTLPEANLQYQELFELKLKMEVGKKMNDSIRVIFKEFDSFEYNIRHERRAVLQESISKTRNISFLLASASIILALLAAFYITRIITSRIKNMVTLAEEISKGNFKAIEDDKKDELKKLSESLNIMSETLDRNFKTLTQKNMELDQFAHVVSHDLKAPLRGIDNLIKWTNEDYKKDMVPGIKKNIELIKGRVIRLENMINGLLEYARIGRTISALEKVDLNLLVNEIIEIIVPQRFNVTITDKLPVFVCYKLMIEQVFTNLLSNAVKHNDRKTGNIRIGCRALEKEYEFSISDDGPGIAAKYHEKIFQVFQTLKERDAFESTGVGLSIVKKIIEENKGTIRLISSPGEGANLIFTWPKVPLSDNNNNINKKP